eukprot:1597107-Lingulodinium_polyedra.AAC.1
MVAAASSTLKSGMPAAAPICPTLAHDRIVCDGEPLPKTVARTFAGQPETIGHVAHTRAKRPLLRNGCRDCVIEERRSPIMQPHARPNAFLGAPHGLRLFVQIDVHKRLSHEALALLRRLALQPAD